MRRAQLDRTRAAVQVHMADLGPALRFHTWRRADPLPAPPPKEQDDAEDGLEIAELRGFYDLAETLLPETVPTLAVAPRANVEPPRRHARGFVVGRVPCGPTATVLLRAALSQGVPLLTLSVADAEGREDGAYAVMAIGSVAQLVLAVGRCFLRMGGERATLDRVESPDGPSIWDRWRGGGGTPAPRRDPEPPRRRDDPEPAVGRRGAPPASFTRAMGGRSR